MVNSYRTQIVLRLVALATFNVGKYKLCLKLLKDNRELFQYKRLTGELRRIQNLCLHALGVLPEAVADQEALVRDEPTSENLLILSKMYFAMGDLRNLAITAREISQQEDLKAEDALRIANIVYMEDKHLAISLWKKAIEQHIPDEFVGIAVTTGFNLGLDAELAPLHDRMVDLGTKGRGGVQMAKIEDLVEHVKKRSEYRQELNNLYSEGSIPIHLFARNLNLSLCQLYHTLLEDNEKDTAPLRHPALLIRHGGRLLNFDIPAKINDWRLHIDITAIILASHLGILDLVEQVFKPLRIAQDVIPALIYMRGQVAHPQPARIPICKQVANLIDKGAIRVRNVTISPVSQNDDKRLEFGRIRIAPIDLIREEGGFLVDFSSVFNGVVSESSPTVHDNTHDHIINCQVVLEALKRIVPLSEAEYEKGLVSLGGEGQNIKSKIIPTSGSRLFCRANIPEILAGANLFKLVCEHFDVSIERAEKDHVLADIKTFESGSFASLWVDNLIGKLRDGILKGTYEIITMGNNGWRDREEKITIEPLSGCLLDLLEFEVDEYDVIWADDRYLNAYLRRETTPIIGICEILNILVNKGILTTKEYYEKLIRLRMSNTLYIPINKDEILHHILEAPVTNNLVGETRALAALRRYLATCLTRGKLFQWPPMPEGSPNSNGEVAFVITAVRAISEAIIELWKIKTNNDSETQARADWLISNLFSADFGPFNNPLINRKEIDYNYLVSVNIAALLSRGIALADDSLLMHEYFDWLQNRVLKKLFEINIHLVSSVADVIKKTLFQRPDELDENIDENTVKTLMQIYYESLPEIIKNELGNDANLMTELGLKRQSIINLGDWIFNPDEFFQAIEDVINGIEVSIDSIQPKEQIVFKPLDDSPKNEGFSCVSKAHEKEIIVKNEEFRILNKSASERENILRQNRNWFDCSDEDFEKVIAEIVPTTNLKKRVDRVQKWRSINVADYYDKLSRLLRQGQTVKMIEFLPPSGEGLLRYFRLPLKMAPDDQFYETITEAGIILKNENGLATALERLAGFPIPISSNLKNALLKMTSRDKRILIKHLIKMNGSPISLIHLINILRLFSPEEKSFERLAHRIITKFISKETRNLFECFLSILVWTNEEFNYWSECKEWSPQVRLALVWAHAHRLFTIFTATGAPIEWLKETFSGDRVKIPQEMFNREAGSWYDVVHPHRINYETFMLGGLSYALIGEKNNLIDEKLQNDFLKLAFQEIDGVPFPILSLLINPSLAENSLNSFFGKDRENMLSILVGSEKSKTYSSVALKNYIVDSFNNLYKNKNDLASWALIMAILSDLAPDHHQSEALKKIIAETDFTKKFNYDLQSLLPLQAASLQLIHLRDTELYNHLADQLVELSELLYRKWEISLSKATDQDKEVLDLDLVSPILIETAIHLSVGAQHSENAIYEFSTLLKRIFEACPIIMPICRHFVQRLCEELPLLQARYFWPLLVRIRTE